MGSAISNDTENDDIAWPRLLPLGADAIIVRFALQLSPAANAAALAFSRKVFSTPPVGFLEVAPSLVSVLVRFNPQATSRVDFCRSLKGLTSGQDWLQVTPPPAIRRWTIPAAFGGSHGPQFTEAARQANLSEALALRDLTSTKLRVLAIGFAPGQPYLGLLPDAWDFARLNELTPKVPAGALVVALSQVVLFANPSPTGWRHVGRTMFRPFRPECEDAFPFQTGDEVMFEHVSDLEYEMLLASENAGAYAGKCEVLT